MLKLKLNLPGVKKAIAERIARVELALITRFKLVGETFVKNARENADFTDRTGNLRASIGFLVLKNGEVITQYFKPGVGGQAGREIANKVAAKFSKGIVLIVTAGMHYSAYVESKGFDVLTSSSLLAEDQLKRAIKEIGGKIPRMQ